jgi:hypothetical protein
MIWPAMVSPAVASSDRAMPKSVSLAVPSGVIRTFCGLMSRWTMPCSCAWSSAASSCSVIRRASSSGSGPPATTSFSERPSIHSMTRNGVPSASSPWS